MMTLRQLLSRKDSNRIHLGQKTAQDLKALSEEVGLPLETVCDQIIQEHLKERLENQEACRRLRLLTPRVQEAAVLHCRGYKDDEIAGQLNISPQTVKAHLRTAVARLGLRRRADLRQALEGAVGEAQQEG